MSSFSYPIIPYRVQRFFNGTFLGSAIETAPTSGDAYHIFLQKNLIFYWNHPDVSGFDKCPEKTHKKVTN